MTTYYALFEMEQKTLDNYELDMTVAIFFNDSPDTSIIAPTKKYVEAYVSNKQMSEILPLIEKGSDQETEFSQYMAEQLKTKFSNVGRVEIQIINGRRKEDGNVSSTLEKFQSKYDLSTLEKMKLKSKKGFLSKIFRR